MSRTTISVTDEAAERLESVADRKDHESGTQFFHRIADDLEELRELPRMTSQIVTVCRRTFSLPPTSTTSRMRLQVGLFENSRVLYDDREISVRQYHTHIDLSHNGR